MRSLVDAGRLAAFGLANVLSAFLLFQVQPLLSKFILPWFGGAPAVWTACMLFFQLVLLGGYAYAHGSIRWLSPRRQVVLHGALLVAALVALPIAPSAAWKPTGADLPLLRILIILAATVGLPYFALSATGPLLQAWFSRTQPAGAPHRLYALSNLGSLAGLLTYPFLVEPLFSSPVQAQLWSWGFLAFAFTCCGCGALLWVSTATSPDCATTAFDASASRPTWGRQMTWFSLAAGASVLLLATTNQVCLDVAVIPFLWILPLSLYLLSFIFCFDRPLWYPRRTYALGLGVTVLCAGWLLPEGERVSLTVQLTVCLALLFCGCMVFHGELVQLRPAPRHLTQFFLWIAAGGAAGGVCVGLLAPLWCARYVELPLIMLGCLALALRVLYVDAEGWLQAGRPRWIWGLVGLLSLIVARSLAGQLCAVTAGELASARNFYGVLRVGEVADVERGPFRVLVHGRILHGHQFWTPEQRRWPTAYYGPTSGVGRALASLPIDRPRNVGVVGLGVGTLAAYARPGDKFTFYEINPDVIRLARSHFTFLSDAPAEVEVVAGDARLSLEQATPRGFDLLVLDAFSSDSIPVHLLTVEAFEVYARHVRPDGIVAVHVSNRHFDLQPVLEAAARSRGLRAMKILSAADPEHGIQAAEWIVLSADEPRLHAMAAEAEIAPPSLRALSPWTDQQSNLVQILK